ncbi:transposase [Gluconacetobacter sp. Hr-1-5]|uniref:transposase n=1 Tax=Gluconacetobacter sp. Hr-1-5 TaxID=3395370 RepID=UPI003B523A7D
MTRIAPIQPESVPISFPGAESDPSKAGGAQAGGGNRSDNSPASADGDTITLSPEAIAALAFLSAEAADGPGTLHNTPTPPDALPTDPEQIMDPDAPPVPAADQILSTIEDAAQAGMDPAFFTLVANEAMSNPALWERAYERTLMAAPDQAASPTNRERTALPPNQVQTAPATRDMAESGARANEEKILAERLLNSGLDEELGPHLPAGRHTERIGNGPHIAQTETDAVVPDVSHGLPETLDPESLAQEIQHFPGVDERMVAMYAPPMGNRTTREPVPETEDQDPSPEPTDQLTGALLDAVTAWQGRRLNALYPVIFFDTLRVTIRDDSTVRDKTVHLVLGMRLEGTVDLLGLWIESHESSVLGHRIMKALKQRGVEDVLMAVVDEHDGFPAAIRTAFPQAQIHPSTDDLLHHLPDFVALQGSSPTAGKTPSATLADSPWGRMLLSATSAIKAMHAMLGRAAQARGHFPSDQAALAFLFQTLNAAGKAVP